MNIKSFFAALLAASLALGANAQDAATTHFKWYGFVRGYYALDTRESISGTEELFYYTPKDVNIPEGGDEDLNANTSFRFAALTSRLGVDVVGYEFKGWKMAGKIEADFYNGITGVTGTAVFRLRQAFITVQNPNWTFKAGQMWHPMAADMPDILSLNNGAPFNPFSRTPVVSAEYRINKTLSATLATIWQMQYNSNGPEKTSANYIRNGGSEWYLALNVASSNGFLGRVGVDVLTITPRVNDGVKKVKEHITTVSPYLYLQYKKNGFTLKAKTILAQAGEHMCLNGGYGITSVDANGNRVYAPSLNSSSWATVQYNTSNGWQFEMYLAYCKNFGTIKPMLGTLGQTEGYGKPAGYYFSKNSIEDGRLNDMFRFTPTILKNWGKLSVGLECEITGANYGDVEQGMNLARGLYDKGVHNVTNVRVQAMTKFTF